MQNRQPMFAASALLCGGLLLASSPALADVELGMMGGGKFYSSDGSLSRAFLENQPNSALGHSGIFGVRVAYLPIPRLALEGEVGVSPTAMRGSLVFPSGVEIQGAKIGVVALRAHLLINLSTGRVRPFVLLGGGGHLSAALSPGVVRDDSKGAVHAGAGLAIDVRPGWGLRFDGRFLLSQGTSAVLTPEGEVLAAVFGRFGGAPAPVTPPAAAPALPSGTEAPVVPPPAASIVPPPAENQAPAVPPPVVPATPTVPPPTESQAPAVPPPPIQPPVSVSMSAQELGSAAQGIVFEPNSVVLAQRSFSMLDQAVRVLKENPSLHMEISGHTDSAGDAQQNRQISQQRAEAVKKYLTDHGVTADRLRAQGYGADKPLAGNDSPEGRAKNRRVEFNLIPPPLTNSGPPAGRVTAGS